jgi:hypothetical protein
VYIPYDYPIDSNVLCDCDRQNKAQVEWFKKRSPLEQKIIIGGVVAFLLMFFGGLIQENHKIQQERYSSGMSEQVPM